MKIFPIQLMLLLFVVSCATEFRPPEWINVPKNLEEAYTELDLMLSEDEKSRLISGEMQVGDLVLGFGMQLKEYWGLWKDSKISKYLRKRDIEHPDQMVTTIFNGYIEYLRNQER